MLWRKLVQSLELLNLELPSKKKYLMVRNILLKCIPFFLLLLKCVIYISFYDIKTPSKLMFCFFWMIQVRIFLPGILQIDEEHLIIWGKHGMINTKSKTDQPTYPYSFVSCSMVGDPLKIQHILQLSTNFQKAVYLNFCTLLPSFLESKFPNLWTQFKYTNNMYTYLYTRFNSIFYLNIGTIGVLSKFTI